MTTLREAATQALEALERLYNDTEIMVTQDQHRVMKGAITALKAALAEPEYPLGQATTDVGVPVYVLKKAEPVQEPLGWAVQIGIHSAGRRQGKPRYTIFFDKADAEALAYRTGTHSQPIPFYLGHGIT